MTKRSLCFFGVLFFLCTFSMFTPSYSQAPTATINLPQGTLVPGTIIQVPVKLNGTNVGIWQMLIRYNRSALTYQSTTFWAGLSFGISGASVYTVPPNDTLFKASWLYFGSSPGMNYNNQVIFTMKFLYHGGTLDIQWAYISTGNIGNNDTYVKANPYNVVNTNTTYTYTYAPMAAGSVAASQTICYNNAPALLTGVPPTGGVSPYSYQWQSSSDNVSFINIPGATGLNYQPGQLTSSTWFRQVQISSAGAGTVTTTSLAITVGPQPPACSGLPTVDYEGKTYHTVQIGGQCWLQENMNVGTAIDIEIPQTDNDTLEKYCYNNLDTNCDVYGGLYQWNEMMQYVSTPGAKGICPPGWHIPSESEMNTLSAFLGGSATAGGAMKEQGTSHWFSPNTGANNCSGFTALPGGYSDSLHTFHDLTFASILWTASETDTENAVNKTTFYTGTDLLSNSDNKTLGFSVRCVRDGIPENKSLQDITVPQGQTTCYNATQTITVAGSGTIFLVQNGGSVTMIAGQNILYLPGTMVEQGGYMSGYIAPGGPYCQTQPVPAVKAAIDPETIDSGMSRPSLRVYPNPTEGIFTVAFTETSGFTKGTIELFSTGGTLVKSIEVTGAADQTFSISELPSGVYIGRFISVKTSEVVRIVKL